MTSDDMLLARIERIEAELALGALINRYHKRADAFDWVGWSECFTGDAVYEMPHSFGKMEGRQRIHDVCKANMQGRLQKMQHIIVNASFELTGSDTATGSANVIFGAVPDKNKPGQNYVSGGRYRWEFRRLPDEGWLISRAEAEPVWNIGTSSGGVFDRSA